MKDSKVKPEERELPGEFRVELGDVVFHVGDAMVSFCEAPPVEARYREILDRIDFSGFPMRYAIEVSYDARTDIAVITVATRVRPRHIPDARFPDVLQSSRMCGFHNSPPERFEVEVVRVVRELLLQNVTHELDEQFYYKGRRIFDPHVLPEGTERGTP